MKPAEQIYTVREDIPYIEAAEDIYQEDQSVSEDGMRVSEEEY